MCTIYLCTCLYDDRVCFYFFFSIVDCSNLTRRPDLEILGAPQQNQEHVFTFSIRLKVFF